MNRRVPSMALRTRYSRYINNGVRAIGDFSPGATIKSERSNPKMSCVARLSTSLSLSKSQPHSLPRSHGSSREASVGLSAWLVRYGLGICCATAVNVRCSNGINAGQLHEKLFTHNGLRMGVVNCCEE